ncbi:MAG: MFS transporter [Dehalococcoidia bacterium]
MLPAAALGLFASGPGQTYSISIFVDSIVDELGWTSTAVSGLYTLGSLTAAAGMLLAGRLLDRFGARVLLCGAAFGLGLAALWMSTVSSQLGLYAGFAALRVFGQGSLTLGSTVLIAMWFVQRRGRATALGSLGVMASGAAFPPLIYLLISQFGWRTAWVVLAFIVWCFIPLAAVFIRKSPESVGLRPDGAPASEAAGAEGTSAIIEGWTLSEAMGTRSFWLVLIATSSQSLITTALVFHQVALLGSKGLDVGISALVLSAMAPASLVGNFLGGSLSDRISNRYLLIAGQVLLLVAMAAALAVAAAWQAVIYGVLLGFASGFLMNVAAVIWPNYYGRRDLGSIRGVATTTMVAAAALGPLPFAFAFDIVGSYNITLLLFALLPLVCAVAAYGAHRPMPSS